MRKARQRAIRAAFAREHGGRLPERTRWRGDFGAWMPSQWRRAKKAHLRAASRSETFLAERAITAAHRVEVARLMKRAARDRRRRAARG